MQDVLIHKFGDYAILCIIEDGKASITIALAGDGLDAGSGATTINLNDFSLGMT